MANISDFERRRRERKRREERRRKRIRALAILIAFIVLVILIIVGISKCSKKNSQSISNNTSNVTATATPSATLMPTDSSFSSIPQASEQNDIMKILRNSGQKKCVYLTFDDGPTDNITPQILDTLRRYGVKATFFQIGSLIDANPDMARRVYEEGHLLANHTNAHNYAKLYVSTDTFMNEINECYEKIKSVTGDENYFKLVRFPGGGFESSADSYSPVKQECKKTLKQYGFYYCDWNALTGDAEGKKKDAQELLEYMIENLDGEDNVVVLMHDAAAKQATADALGSVIEYFMDQGYTFKTLDQIDYNGISVTSSPSAGDDDEDEDTDSDDEDSDNSSSSTSKPKSTSKASTPSPSASSKSGSSESSSSSSSSSNNSSSNNSSGPIIIQ